MRLIGAIVLTAAFLGGGLTAVSGLRERVRQREEVCRLLMLMEYEIGRFRTPFPQLFAQLSQQSAGRCAELCRRVSGRLSQPESERFSQIWAYGLEALDERERGILAPLGGVLGRYGVQEQLEAVADCRMNARQALEAARQAAGEKSRIYVGLSAAGGVVLSVLLL